MAQFLTAPTRDHTLPLGLGRSSNGRTRGSGPRSGGSSPPLPANRFRLTDVAPSSRGLGHGPLKSETRVRIPLGPPENSPWSARSCRAFHLSLDCAPRPPVPK